MSTFDLTFGYHQFEIEEKDRSKTAFRFKGGFYEYIRVPFELKNAPAFFQRMIDLLFKEYNYKFVIIYLDDLIVFSENEDDHAKNLRQVMNMFKNSNITLESKNTNFLKRDQNSRKDSQGWSS